MRNVHQREIPTSLEKIRPFIEAGWTGTSDDPFPRDYIKTWRKNPPDRAADALVPGVTRLGHGPFSFRFVSWDGKRWRVCVESGEYRGWHGFDLEPTPNGTRVRHTIELDLSGPARVVWPLFIAPVHDWAVEAIFDRMEEALRTGTMPPVTARKMPFPASLCFSAIGVLRRRRRRRR